MIHERVINACRKLAALLHAFLSEGRAGQLGEAMIHLRVLRLPLSLLLSIETRFEISIGIIIAGNDLEVNWLPGKSIFDNPSKRWRRSALQSLPSI